MTDGPVFGGEGGLGGTPCDTWTRWSSWTADGTEVLWYFYPQLFYRDGRRCPRDGWLLVTTSSSEIRFCEHCDYAERKTRGQRSLDDFF